MRITPEASAGTELNERILRELACEILGEVARLPQIT